MVEMRNQKELKVDHDAMLFEDPAIDVSKAKDVGAAGSRGSSSHKGKASTKTRGAVLGGDSGAAAAAVIARDDGWGGFPDGLPRSDIETDNLSSKDMAKVLISVSEDVRLTVQSETSIKEAIMILYEMLTGEQITELVRYNKESSDPLVQECISRAETSLQRRYLVAGSETGGSGGVGVAGGVARDLQVQGGGGGVGAVITKGANAYRNALTGNSKGTSTNGRIGGSHLGKLNQVNTDARNYNRSMQQPQLPGPSVNGASVMPPPHQGTQHQQQQPQQQQQVASGTPQRSLTAADIEFRNKIDQRRKFNIIVMGVPETNMAGGDERFITDMLYYMNCGRAVDCIVNIARLGKFRGKRRLVKVDFNDTRAAREVLDSSYCLAGSWYSNIYIKTDRTFAEREQVENSKSSHILAQSASGANGNASTGTVPDQVQRGGKQSRWEANQIEKGDSRSGPDQDNAQGGDDKIVANASNTGVELVQNMGKLVNEMRPKANQGTKNPVAETTQDQAKNEGSSKGAEGGQSQGLVQGPQDSSDGGDIWHLASEGDEMQVGGGYKQGDRGDRHRDSKTGGCQQ